MNERILWGRDSSANVQKAIWALEELGLSYRRIDAGGPFGGLDTAEFATLNPNRLVPVLQDGDLTVWESSAIVRYLAARYGAGTLWPEDPRQRAEVDQWADWCISTFQPAWIEVYVQMVRTAPSKRNADSLGKAMVRTNAGFALLDRQLAGRDYLCGGRLTYADILVGVSLYRWAQLDVTRIAMPHVDAWHKRLSARPAFVRAVEVDFSAMYVRD